MGETGGQAGDAELTDLAADAENGALPLDLRQMQSVPGSVYPLVSQSSKHY